MAPVLSDLEAYARGAGEILRRGFSPRPGAQGRLRVEHKSEIDLVTEYDHLSEAYLIGEVRGAFPDHSIVSEESGDSPGQACCLWYIDPLDGTVNYAHGVPIFAVSIAYQESGLVRLGVVFDPLREEMFSAERGKGAWLNGEPLRVAATPNLNNSLLATGFPYDVRGNPQNNLDYYNQFALRSQGVRRLGSAALDLGYVAAGRLDGYWEIRLGPWDLAAGGLIAMQAGATVTSVEGSPDYLQPPYSVLAANSAVHAQMLAVFQEDATANARRD